MVTLLIIVFIVGYLCIALENILDINKAVPSLLMCVVCWVIFSVWIAPDGFETHEMLLGHLGDTGEILFFLMGAMTIVEVVDAYGGFDFVHKLLSTTHKRRLMWGIAALTFVQSAILDNLTTSIVMVMVLNKLVADRKDRMFYGGMIILAANAGGAFSPIGDVTTIMLWIRGMITSWGVIEEVLLPSLVAVIVAGLFIQPRLKGKLIAPGGMEMEEAMDERSISVRNYRKLIFFVGVFGLMSVPVFKMVTGLPPFMGILLILGLLWLIAEIVDHKLGMSETSRERVASLLSRIDLTTILFFLGILMAVATLQEAGILTHFGQWLNTASDGNHYLVTGLIGIVSSVVDNVPLVAACMDMYNVAPVGDFAVDGIFWQLLAYCAGVGGSILIIGSAAGVVVMGLEKISFGWYLKNISWVAVLSYISGIGTYALVDMFVK